MRLLIVVALTLLLAVPGHAINPVREYLQTPDSLGLTYVQRWIPTTDELRLNSWMLHPDAALDNHTTVVVAYGDAGNMSNVLFFSSLLVQRGFTILLFDYRGFGGSSDFPIEEDFLFYNEFAEDTLAAMRWAKRENTDHSIGIWSFSMGTIMAAKALQSEPVDFYIGEGVLYDPSWIVGRIREVKKKIVRLPESEELTPRLYNDLSCKMLLFAGTEDEITTVADSRAVTAMADDRELVIYKGPHGRGLQTLRMEYLDRIVAFIKE